MFVEKCLRCLPHDDDTGGFFVATLRKKSSKSLVETNTIDNASANSTLKVEYEEGTARDLFINESIVESNVTAVSISNHSYCSSETTVQQVHVADASAAREPRDKSHSNVDVQLWDAKHFEKVLFVLFVSTLVIKFLYRRKSSMD